LLLHLLHGNSVLLPLRLPGKLQLLLSFSRLTRHKDQQITFAIGAASSSCVANRFAFIGNACEVAVQDIK
jgi:hypothetical protein